MYPTERCYENFGTWFQYVTAVFGERDLRRGVRILRRLIGPLTPREALDLVEEWMALFGPAGPEVSGAATFFFLHMLENLDGEEEFIAPNLSDLERLREALIEFVSNKNFVCYF
ncbi:Protein of unknown function [Cotesia congregata]|uniref:Uncharacterized protein n=1 Tax=Cotesia congregata TaxID=51543 RepID=A0A8J2H9T3_COTCN|nr:Protein of unknown function [Cotesia congregata]